MKKRPDGKRHHAQASEEIPLVAQLIDAACEDHNRAAALLRDHPGLLSERWFMGETPLHFCAVENLERGVKYLLKRGADPNLPNKFGGTALGDCIVLGRERETILRLLLEFGADPKQRHEPYGDAFEVAQAFDADWVVPLLNEAVKRRR